MKKLYILSILSLSLSLLLTGCGKNQSSNNSDSMTENSISDGASDSYIIDSQTPPSDGMVRSRLTNEWIKPETYNTRPVALMIPNSGTASYYGLSEASILYEANVEGSMTRLMGIFEDWKDIEKLGNIRSSRDYFIYWAFEWDAIYMHYGGPFYIDEVIERSDTQNINCINLPDSYFQTEAKNTTDDCFTSGERITEAMEKLGYKEEYRNGYADPQHYLFAPFDTPNTLEQYDNSITANKIDMSTCYPVTNCYFVYNEETKQYERFQNIPGTADMPHIDEANHQQLMFKNVIVQNTYHEVRDQKGYLAFQVHDDTRDGWFFTNGRGIHVNWKKISDYGATRYYDDLGNEIQLNTGKTMVLIVEDGDTFLVDGQGIK